ncbi:MAG: pseudouridine synthase [Woeseiaceae bacterium]
MTTAGTPDARRNYTAPVPLILFNKPYGVLCQFSRPDKRPTLKDYVTEANVYPAGRLDLDSEGLVLLTDDGALQARISQPAAKMPKRYWAQVEGIAGKEQLERLRRGVTLKDGRATALEADLIEEPKNLWPREPPIRERRNVPTSWIELVIDEGRNRQVRRMTAAAGLPTLRLVRHAVGPWTLAGLESGEVQRISNAKAWQSLAACYRAVPLR